MLGCDLLNPLRICLQEDDMVKSTECGNVTVNDI